MQYNLNTIEAPSDWITAILALALIYRLWPYVVQLTNRPWSTIVAGDLLKAGFCILIAARGVMALCGVGSIGSPHATPILQIGRTFANCLTILACIPATYGMFGTSATFRLLAAAIGSGALMAAFFYAYQFYK